MKFICRQHFHGISKTHTISTNFEILRGILRPSFISKIWHFVGEYLSKLFPQVNTDINLPINSYYTNLAYS
jgi:hypothetical protein